jgi:predicted nucleic acid-binding protein
VTFLVDANIAIYAAVASPYRAACLEILEAIARGRVDGKMSTAVLEEVWHIELSGRAGALEGLSRRIYETFTPLLPVTDDVVSRAFALRTTRLGASDRIHIATALAHGIDTIVSADTDFDDIRTIRRVDPLDAGAVRRLLG